VGAATSFSFSGTGGSPSDGKENPPANVVLAQLTQQAPAQLAQLTQLTQQAPAQLAQLAPAQLSPALTLSEVDPVPERSVMLQHPFSMLLCGPTGSGKTSLLKKILEHDMIEPSPHYIVWYYKIWQPLYQEMQNTIPNLYFKEGLPSNEELREHAESPRLFVLDDLMSEATDSPEVCGMFTEGSHHYNYSVCCLIQNLFFKGRMQRTISLNANYIVFFKSPRDSQQAAILAKQMFPTATEKLMKPYTEATMKPYGYLFIDLKQTTPETDRIVKNVFPVSISGEQYGTTNSIMNYTSTQMEAKRQKLDTACPVCGVMFDTIAHRDKHLEKWEKPLANDDSIFEVIFKEVQENEDTHDSVNAMKRLYRNTLVRIHALDKSQKHRDMYEEFQSLLQSYSPEMAAKLVVDINDSFFEYFDDEESNDSDQSL